MKITERIARTLNFQPVDRLPMIEWFDWWDKTLKRWYSEGLDPNLTDAGQIRERLGLDSYRVFWANPKKQSCPERHAEGSGLIATMDDYLALKSHLFPADCLDEIPQAGWFRQHLAGDMAVWFWVEGFFWFPRTLFGIEKHLYAFYDQPELMHTINKDVLDFNIALIDKVCKVGTPVLFL